MEKTPLQFLIGYLKDHMLPLFYLCITDLPSLKIDVA